VSARSYQQLKDELRPIVQAALADLRARHDVVVCEGAGSPAEINLRARDIVNMRVALHCAPRADVVLVADIDRGGAFAALLGTLEWLAPEERALVRGSVLNRFRGDATLLAPAPDLLAQRTGVPVLGVVPYVDRLGLPDEDAASLTPRHAASALVEIAVVRLPHLSNFDEFGPLSLEQGVHVVWVESISQLRAPDLVIVPGSKATISDLCWLRERGLAERITWLARHGTPVLGICGGMQMLGEIVRDPFRIESAVDAAPGLGLLPLATVLDASKTLRQVHGSGETVDGFWGCLAGVAVSGYEIHLGQTPSADRPLLRLTERADGSVLGDVAGTYVHGLFEGEAARGALVQALLARRGFAVTRPEIEIQDPYDRLADVLESALDLSLLTVIPVQATRNSLIDR